MMNNTAFTVVLPMIIFVIIAIYGILSYELNPESKDSDSQQKDNSIFIDFDALWKAEVEAFIDSVNRFINENKRKLIYGVICNFETPGSYTGDYTLLIDEESKQYILDQLSDAGYKVTNFTRSATKVSFSLSISELNEAVYHEAAREINNEIQYISHDGMQA